MLKTGGHVFRNTHCTRDLLKMLQCYPCSCWKKNNKCTFSFCKMYYIIYSIKLNLTFKEITNTNFVWGPQSALLPFLPWWLWHPQLPEASNDTSLIPGGFWGNLKHTTLVQPRVIMGPGASTWMTQIPPDGVSKEYGSTERNALWFLAHYSRIVLDSVDMFFRITQETR